MKKIKSILFLLFALVNCLAKAQLYFKNNTEEPVQVAICMHYQSKSSSYFGSEGQWVVDPGDKIMVNSAIGMNTNLYYYARSTTSKKIYSGEMKILVHPHENFFIKNADKEYQKKENAAYAWYKFRHINMNVRLLQLKYTIELNY